MKILKNGQLVDASQSEVSELQRIRDEKISSLDNYVEKRIAAYPPITDQLDMLYKDSVNGTSTWVSAIQAVKNQYPKPTE